MSHHNPSFIQEPGGQIERYVPPEPFCVVFIKRSFPIPSSQFHRADATHWTLNLSNFVGTGYSEIKECCLCVNGANGAWEREQKNRFVCRDFFGSSSCFCRRPKRRRRRRLQVKSKPVSIRFQFLLFFSR